MQNETQEQKAARILRELANEPRNSSDPILGVNVQEMQRAKNGGYPRDLYHQTLQPVQVMNRSQEMAMAGMGYVRNYIHRHYPKFMYCRNMAKKFEASGFVEERLVHNEAQEHQLLNQKWRCSIGELEAPDAPPSEDPKITIARLQGQIESLQGAEPRRGPGRPPNPKE
jgi:hypothetical protein